MQTYRAIGRTGVSKRRNHLATYDLNTKKETFDDKFDDKFNNDVNDDVEAEIEDLG